MGTYEPKPGDIVQVRADYKGEFGDNHKNFVGLVMSKVLHPKAGWVVAFMQKRLGSVYDATEIEPLPVGTRLRYSPFDTSCIYLGSEGTKDEGIALHVRWPDFGYEGKFPLYRSDVTIVERVALPTIAELDAAPQKKESSAEKVIGFAAYTVEQYGRTVSDGEIAVKLSDLAWRVFCTDERVKKFARERSESGHSPDQHRRRGQVLTAMWERDESGWRKEAERRAEDITGFGYEHYPVPGSKP